MVLSDKKRVLITGANGYIGSHVTGKLLDMGCDVLAADVRFDDVDKRAERTDADIFSGSEDIFDVFGKPDICIHLAWRDGFNHKSPVHMLDLSKHYEFIRNMVNGGLRHLVIMGSMHEIGYYEGEVNEDTPASPLSVYGIAKNSLRQAAGILAAENKDLVMQWIRGFYIIGDDRKNHSIFSKLLSAADEGKKTFPFTSGANKYDFTDIEEMASDIVMTALQDKYRGVINCCSGKAVSLKDKVGEFIEKNDLDIRLEYGAYPDRPYDSPAIWGNTEKIEAIRRLYK